MTTGIALPRWIVESKNNAWVLGVYAFMACSLEVLYPVVWQPRNDKDGIHARSAAEFFKSLREDSGADQVFSTLGKSFSWEHSTLLPHAQNGRQTTQFGQR